MCIDICLSCALWQAVDDMLGRMDSTTGSLQQACDTEMECIIAALEEACPLIHTFSCSQLTC